MPDQQRRENVRKEKTIGNEPPGRESGVGREQMPGGEQRREGMGRQDTHSGERQDNLQRRPTSKGGDVERE